MTGGRDHLKGDNSPVFHHLMVSID